MRYLLTREAVTAGVADRTLTIDHAEWQSMWKQCSRITEHYKPQVRIERLRSFREGTKYAVKDSDFVRPRADGDGFDADVEVVAGLYLGTFKRRLVGWSHILVAIRKSLGLTPDGDDEPAIVPNHGFAECYTYVGDEKYGKSLVSRRRVEYRFCSFVPAKSDDRTPIVGERLEQSGREGYPVGGDANDTS